MCNFTLPKINIDPAKTGVWKIIFHSTTGDFQGLE